MGNFPYLGGMTEANDPIRKLIDDCSEAIGLAPSTICLRALNDGGFYSRIIAGGDCTRRTEKKLRDWIAKKTPKESEAPSDG